MKFSHLLITCGLIACMANPTMMCKVMSRGIELLAVYTNDILFIGNDDAGISTAKAYHHQHFVSQNL